uniref:Transmembrane protein 65 n=1 Tax=Panagrolaimus sp. ES5 TaxID=591445 RepID=A0AC34GU78_9BILA
MSWTRLSAKLLPKKVPRFRNSPKQCYLKPDLNLDKKEEETVSSTFLSIGIYDNESAKLFIERLLPGERDLLNDIIERKREEELIKQTKDVEEVHHEDLVNLWWVNCIPFCGYGFLDNALMIVVGESVDRTIGLYVGISIMGAAALGNIVSSLFGLGLVHYVERLLFRYFNLRTPMLSVKQSNHWSVGFISNLGKVCGLLFGCTLGMFPLLFYDSPERLPPHRSIEADENEAETMDLELKENDFSANHLDTVARTLNPEIFKEYEQFRKDWQNFSTTSLLNDAPDIDEDD